MDDRIPASVQLGSHYDSVILALFVQRKETAADAAWYNPLGVDTLLGFIVPSWQRGLVWSKEQKVSFVESVWRGIPLGTYTYNSPVHPEPRFRGLLIDGQQRLNAICEYVDNRFSVFALHYRDLSDVEKRRFTMTKFCSYEFHSADEKELRAYYNLMNFGGTAHRESERA